MAKGAYVGIPTSYTPVEYIENSGTQYIDTEYTPVSNSKIIANIMQLTLNNSNYGSIMGNSTGGLRTFVASGYIRQTIGSTDQSSTTAVSLNTKYQVTLNDNGTSYWEQTIGTKIGFITGTPSTITSTSTFEFFSQSGGAIWGTARLYDCKIYENDILIRDFIPVLDENNVVCLYEQVEGKFYYNKGTGTFTAGNAGQPVSIGGRARKITKAYVGVPASYTPVEYIESSGTQYIDTDFKPNNNTKVVAQMGGLASASAFGHIFGARDSAGVNEYAFSRSDTGIFRSDYGASAERKTFPSGMDLTGTFTVDKNKNVMTINSSSVTNGMSSFQTSVSLYLFAMHNGDSTGPGFAVSCKLYYLKIYDDNILVRDYIPALDDNNVACLYEQVEGKFYYNKGTGTFTAGSTTGQSVSIGGRARKILKGYVGVRQSYTPVEYIESSGTQYIDTGIYPYQTELEIQFQYTSLSAITYLSGSYNDNDNRYGLIANRPSNNDICYGDRSNNYYTLGTADTNIHTIVYNNSSHQVIYDNVAKGTISDLTAIATRTLYLFAYHVSTGVANFASARIMYCKIKDKTTNTLIRDFIPVVDQDNIACMYDLVEGKFYYNKGTGVFTAGNATGQPVMLDSVAQQFYEEAGLQFVNYIESTGTQYIDTGVVMTLDIGIEFQFQKTNNSGWTIVSGVSQHGGYTKNIWLIGTDNGWFTVSAGNSGSYAYTPLIAQNLNVNTLAYNKPRGRIVINGVTKSDYPNIGTGHTNSVYIFANNPTGTSFSKVKIYYYKMYDLTTNTLIRDFKPALLGGVPGLYDAVNNQFYYNLGTGTFSFG